MIEMFLQINMSFEEEFVDGWGGGDQWLIMYNFDDIYLYTENLSAIGMRSNNSAFL